jgi:hypothetical protein
MNQIRETIPTDNGDEFDPGAAAALLGRTTAAARRQFEPYPPWLLVVRAVLALGVYGALWLSVRGQHPYAHPTVAVIPVGVAVGVINVVATMAVARRATAGIGGRSRWRPAEISLMVLLWIAVFGVMGVMIANGVSARIVYGLYPATAPVIVVGVIWAVIMAARADWRLCIGGLAAAAVGAVALLAGPAGAWAVVGIGLFVILLGRAVETYWRQRV